MVSRLGELRRAAGVDRAELRAVAGAGCEDGGVAAVRGPLDVAAQVGDDGVGARVAERRRLLLGADEGPHVVPATEQEGHDTAPQPPVGTGDEYDHATFLPGWRTGRRATRHQRP